MKLKAFFIILLLACLILPAEASTFGSTRFYTDYDAGLFLNRSGLAGHASNYASGICSWSSNEINPAGSFTYESDPGNHTCLEIAKMDYGSTLTDVVTMSDGATHTILVESEVVNFVINYANTVTITIDGTSNISYMEWGPIVPAVYIDLFVPKNSETYYQLLGCTGHPYYSNMGVAANITTGAYIVKHDITANSTSNIYRFRQFTATEYQEALDNTVVYGKPTPNIIDLAVQAFDSLKEMLVFVIDLMGLFYNVIILNWWLWVGLFEGLVLIKAVEKRSIFDGIRYFAKANTSAFKTVVQVMSFLASVIFYVVNAVVNLIKWW